MAKKTSSPKEPAPATGPVSHDDVERLHVNLQKLAADTAALADQMKAMELDTVDVWGWTKASRGYKTLYRFLDQLEAAMLREKRMRRYEGEY